MSQPNVNFLEIDNSGFHQDNIDYEQVYSNIFLSSENGLIVLDEHCQVVSWNPWFSKYSRIDMGMVLGQSLYDVFPCLQGGRVDQAVNAALNAGVSSVISHTLNHKPFPLKCRSGQFLEQHITVKPISIEGRSTYCFIQINDMSEAVTREKQLLEQVKKIRVISESLVREKERAKLTLDSITDAVITTDEKGIILSMNPVAEVLIGVFEDEVKGKAVAEVFTLFCESTLEPVLCPVMQCLEQQDVVTSHHEHVLKGAMNQLSITDSVAPIFDDDENMLGTILVFRDVTQSRAISAELNWQALHDPLTGLANRRKFESEMKKLLAKAQSNNIKHHLLYLDLDQFKVVNDTCGHDAGDELLKQITDTLDRRTRKSDLLARLGGDEFGVLLDSCDAEHALVVANNLRLAVEDFRFGWQTQSFKIGVSIGIAEITGEESKASEVLSAADAACYAAKESGRNRVHFHEVNSSASATHQKEMQWISRIQAALDNDGFELYLQRIQKTGSLSVASNCYEVLLRMLGDEGEMIPPGAFFPAAERFNLASSLDRWVIDHVFEKLDALENSPNKPENLMLSINISGGSMTDDKLLERIGYLLDKSSLPANNFCFEVTETAAIANLTQAQEFLSTLRSKGCRIALDDFGSGLSSFAYLKSLPIDAIKIDGYFVKDMVDDPIDKVFVESIHQMGQVMGLTTIAEFVEDNDILDILVEMGVDYAQGYGVHTPCPFDEAIMSAL